MMFLENIRLRPLAAGDLVQYSPGKIGIVLKAQAHHLTSHCLVRGKITEPQLVICTGWTYGPFDNPASYAEAKPVRQQERVGVRSEYSIYELTKLLS